MQVEKMDSWICYTAKLGYFSRGVVYMIVGIFAAFAIFGEGNTMGSKGALLKLLEQPLGSFLLGATAVGLVCYSIWRTVQSLWDTDNHGTELKGLTIRGGLLISAVLHLSLAWWAVQIILNLQSNSSSSWSSWLMSQSWGYLVMGAIALGVFCVGCAHIIKGYTERFLKYFKRLPNENFRYICQFGLITKGLAFFTISYLLLQTAMLSGSSGGKGLNEALMIIRQQTYGWLLLAVMGFGLISFSIYSMLESKYRKVGVRK